MNKGEEDAFNNEGDDAFNNEGDTSHAKVIQSRCDNMDMSACSIKETRVAQCTSAAYKCRGKYRINFKGAACHVRACCGEK